MTTSGESQSRILRAESYFKYGDEALQKGNYDYAIQMFKDACKLVPEELKYRLALRGTQRRAFGNDPAKVGRMVGARTQPIRLRARTTRMQGNHAHALEIFEEAFGLNPWDVGASKEAAESAEHLGLKRLAQWYLESVQAQANDADFFRYQAHIHQLNEDWTKAIQSWEQVKRLDPNDETANRQINALSASHTITRSGLKESIQKGSQGSSGPETAKADSAELKRQSLTPEERYRLEIREDPTRVGPYLGLAEHYKQRNQLDEAEQVLAAGLKAVPGDGVLQTAHADVQLARIRRAVDAWTKKAQKDPNDGAAKAKLEQLTVMLNEYELKELRRRSAARPDDLGLRFEIGRILARSGKHDEAITEFQQARNSPGHKVQALLHAGLSFEATGIPKLAEKNYQDALRAADPKDQTTLNEVHYRLGRICEAMGNLKDAEEHYNEVAANDYGYADVAKRLRALNQGSGA